jgi:hypothetical protein
MTGDVSPAGGAGELRASHADRDQVVEVLRIAAGDGRITAEELDQRLEAALNARTLGELTVLTTDLPAASAHTPTAGPAPAKDVVRIDCKGSTVRRDGPWIVPRRLEIQVVGGHVLLDFTEAVIAGAALDIDADVHGGTLRLITIPSLDLDIDGVAVEGGSVRVRRPERSGLAPRLQITIAGHVRGGTLSARPPRRTFLEWLRRRPASPRAAIGR